MKSIDIQPAISEAVTGQIRDAIVEGTLAPGSRIKQQHLASLLNVSRAPIRQALMLLKREGLVQIRHHRSAIVSPLDSAFISDIYDLREAIEGHTAARLAERTSFDLGPSWKIVAQGQQAVASGDLDCVIDLDLAFHRGLCEALGNRPLISIMDAQWGHLRRVMIATVNVNSNRKQVWNDHATILNAIGAGHPEEARAASIAHTRAACAVLLDNLKEFVANRHSPRVRRREAARPAQAGAQGQRD